MYLSYLLHIDDRLLATAYTYPDTRTLGIRSLIAGHAGVLSRAASGGAGHTQTERRSGAVGWRIRPRHTCIRNLVGCIHRIDLLN